MFPRESGTELKSGFLRRGRRFRFGKRRKSLFRRGSCSTEQEEEGYKFTSYLDEGSFNEEEVYQLISEENKESEESTKALEPEHVLNSPMVPEVRTREPYPSISVNTSSTNAVNRGQGSLTSPHFVPTIHAVNTVPVNPMAGTDIKFPIFNGNGLEDPEQHYFFV